MRMRTAAVEYGSPSSRRLSDDLIVVGGFVALRGLVGFLGLHFDEGVGSR